MKGPSEGSAEVSRVDIGLRVWTIAGRSRRSGGRAHQFSVVSVCASGKALCVCDLLFPPPCGARRCEVESLPEQFVACIVASRVLLLSFWCHGYEELKMWEHDGASGKG